MANRITGCRILCSAAMLGFPVFSPAFYMLYLIAGFTDMIDGTIARKTNTVSELGSRLDYIADCVFFAVCLVKLAPVMVLPLWLWLWIAGIGVLKLTSLFLIFLFRVNFSTVHSLLNKITGFLLFVLPLTLPLIPPKYSVIFVCAAATLAAAQECILVCAEAASSRPAPRG